VLLRFGWLLDDSRDGVLGRVLQRLEQSEAILLADDRRGNPTPADDAARVILAVLKQLDCQAPLWGTYHYGGHAASTPVLVAQALPGQAAKYPAARRAGLQEDIHHLRYQAARLAHRPAEPAGALLPPWLMPRS